MTNAKSENPNILDQSFLFLIHSPYINIYRKNAL
nr:MAG TPA: hypothetical protein [Caudoviricetes sp.]DAH00406.1 MAG TPA: hypothetical protein [Crassvirales sp.]